MNANEKADAVVAGLADEVVLRQSRGLSFFKRTTEVRLSAAQVSYMKREYARSYTCDYAEIAGLSDKKEHCGLPCVVIRGFKHPAAEGFQPRAVGSESFCVVCAAEFR